MSVKSRFCKVLTEVKEKEMREFIEAVNKRNFRKAADILESLGAMTELGIDICDIGEGRRRR